MMQKKIKPFLKWPGGKRWFVANHAGVFPRAFDTYIEPFLGGGSVFFHLKPKRAILGDTNAELINAYRGIQAEWISVQAKLRSHHRNHSAEHYYTTRDTSPRSLASQAARLIYLNRTCFNGIYRVNLKGQFNVPKGTKTAVVFDSDDFEAIASILAKARLCVSDFEPLVDQASKGDLLFCDPPYTVRHNNNGFIKYNEKLFSWNDQIRLAKAVIKAAERGASVVLTNAEHDSIRSLYRGHGFSIRRLTRFSPISATSESRKAFGELLITSYADNGGANG